MNYQRSADPWARAVYPARSVPRVSSQDPEIGLFGAIAAVVGMAKSAYDAKRARDKAKRAAAEEARLMEEERKAMEAAKAKQGEQLFGLPKNLVLAGAAGVGALILVSMLRK